MLMPVMSYRRPENLAELGAMTRGLTDQRVPFYFLSGGTDLVPRLKQSPAAEGILISLAGIADLREIVSGNDAISIGAGCRISDLVTHAEVCRTFPALVQAARLVATPQIRNQATLGGNIMVENRCRYFNQPDDLQCANGTCFKAGGDRCHLFPRTQPGDALLCRARFVSDIVPVLMLLEASLQVTDGRSERTLEIRALYREDGLAPHTLAKNEIIRAVLIKRRDCGHVGYEKLRIRNAMDFPAVGVAGQVINLEGELHIRVVLTGVGMAPVAIGMAAVGRDRQSHIAAVADAARKAAKPLDQDFLPTGYRRQVIPVMVQNLLQRLAAGV